ncbi:MAG: glycosyl transferase [Candidatus Yanofskybacteria bacterium CG10_big_fil_rev_8_21_14_0_10_36_16]|uniref:Glycosyl transferase n=1 Tax=Candidatus Yanofskybacteria bacterium CG10_big_fil_rev_8_21_14_0_10_36_16 TaxID=1975096 RepID=A0A2J0Q8C3_9BACT|nr:MAG: glycosyl transferase [Candidatus Yanofskybacteria bacterium CG10_big_fil_rev_8_21_14_0_10_36_16]
MKVALVHEYLNQYGGAERVLEAFCEVFPEAPIYTLVYDERATGGVFKNKEIHTSFIQKIPFSKKHHRIFPLFMPLAVEQFDLSYFDVVISNAHSFGKGIITKPHTKHISYCMTPTRFLWDDSHRYVSEFKYAWPVKKLIPLFLNYLRIWDKEAALRVDEYVANSNFVKNRIKKYYKRDASVIHPFVNADKYNVSYKNGGYFLMVGRMVPYKRFDLAIKVFSAIKKPLKIVGGGPELKKLKKMAKPNIEFLGLVSDYKMPEIYNQAEAIIFPQEEDFGIVPLEAMASGRPVIAYRGGGALETVAEDKTGVFFDEQTEIDLVQAIGRYYQVDWDPQAIRQHALKFDKPIFKQKIIDLLTK